MKEEKKENEEFEQENVAVDDSPTVDDAVADASAYTSGGSPSDDSAGKESDAEEGAAPSSESEGGESESNGDASEQPSPAAPDWKDMYARMRADFENFRKRTERDRDDLAKFAASGVLKDVLPTVDDLARALDGAKDKKDDPFVSGVQLVYDGLVKMLADHGATPLDSVGEPFDANYHEALATLPSPDVPEGNVMTEVKRGWLLNGKLLRAAQVVVSAGK